MSISTTIASLELQVGQELGVTDWFQVTQKDADLFSALTDDWDYMHNDPTWAAQSEWGGTIAHGLYVLSLIPSFLKHTTDLPIVSDNPEDGLGVNYGFNRVRFVAPLRIGDRARAHVSLLDVSERDEGAVLLTTETKVFAESDLETPTMVAENLVYISFDTAEVREH